MPTFIRYNFEDLFKLSSSLQSILVALPDLKKEVLRSIAARYRSQIQGQMLTQGIKYTGTYEQSIKIEFRGSREEPTIALVMRPQGIGADRLPIYWKVLEFGANPSPNVLSAPIKAWVGVKGYDGDIGGAKVLGVEHIGIALNNNEQLSKIFKDIFNLDYIGSEVINEQGVNTDIFNAVFGNVAWEKLKNNYKYMNI